MLAQLPMDTELTEGLTFSITPTPGYQSRIGNCYELAAKEVLYGLDDTARLVHGTIQGFGHDPNPHAWVERADGTCYDGVIDQEIPGVIYRHFFNAKERVSYSVDEARVMVLKEKTWGCWDQ